MLLWTAAEVCRATGGTLAGATPEDPAHHARWAAHRVVIDSRQVQPGDLFVALRGEHQDGHRYVAEALRERGAVACLVAADADLPGIPAAQLVRVADTFRSLEALGRHARARSGARVVGLTGSVGKTSTKDMLTLALSAYGPTYATAGNLNNHYGVPLTLANLPPQARFAVIEMGMNHAGEIAALTRQVRPHVALITAVEAVHLEFFPDVAAIADAKAEIFQGLEQGGTAIIPADNPHTARLHAAAQRCGAGRIEGFGDDSGGIPTRALPAEAALQAYKPTNDGAALTLRIGQETVHCALGVDGKHWAVAAASVLLAVRALLPGSTLRTAADALASFRAPAGRGALHVLPVPSAPTAPTAPTPGGTFTLLDDSYNASPASVRAACARVAALAAGNPAYRRVVLALGDMRELGPTAPALHAALVDAITAIPVDTRVFTAGPLMAHLHSALPAALRGDHAPAAEDLLPLLRAALLPGDIVLVKGSHGSHMYTLAQALRTRSV